MKRRILFWSLLWIPLVTQAQQNPHFVYIQTNSGQLFYVKIANTLLSSSQSGYIIIPGLRQGDIQLTIGFPRNQFPEQVFDLHLQNHDEGYLLQPISSQRFELQNLTDFSLLHPLEAGSSFPPLSERGQPPKAVYLANSLEKNPGDSTGTQGEQADTGGSVHQSGGVPSAVATQVNKFQALLEATSGGATDKILMGQSSAGNHSTVMENIPPRPRMALVPKNKYSSEVNQSDSTSDAVSNNENLSGNGDSTRELAVSQTPPALATPPSEDTISSRVTQQEVNFPGPAILPDTSSLVSGHQAFAFPLDLGGDHQGRKPSNSQVVNQPEFLTFIGDHPDTAAGTASGQPPNQPDQGGNGNTIPTRGREPFADQGGSAGAGRQLQKEPVRATQGKSLTMINSDCTAPVSENFFLKTRRKVAMQNNDSQMLKVVGKFFREDCFTVAQIQSIAYLFSSDEARFQFLQLAYAHVLDSDHYSRLEGTLTDPFIRKQFLDMISKK
ncbi:MAG: DUF4476 domain-containing protein [Chitinophagaceae bacterium]